MEIAFDPNALQVHVHRIGKSEGVAASRLDDLIRGLTDKGIEPNRPFENGKSLTQTNFQQADVLMIPTRLPKKPFDEGELDAIEEFVLAGGGLFILTNHGPVKQGQNDFTSEDRRLATIFGVEIDESFFRNDHNLKKSELARRELNQEHPIILGNQQSQPVKKVVTNNCSSLRSEHAEGIISLPPNLENLSDNSTPNADQWFCMAIDQEDSSVDAPGTGRVVVVSDSGFIGSRSAPVRLEPE